MPYLGILDIAGLAKVVFMAEDVLSRVRKAMNMVEKDCLHYAQPAALMVHFSAAALRRANLAIC
jgi:hypothetical protein